MLQNNNRGRHSEPLSSEEVFTSIMATVAVLVGIVCIGLNFTNGTESFMWQRFAAGLVLAACGGSYLANRLYGYRLLTSTTEELNEAIKREKRYVEPPRK